MLKHDKSEKLVESSVYSSRSAFLLNANAKNVNAKVIGKLASIIPFKDLFYCRNSEDSEHYIRKILKRGYGKVFSGGGDGTLVNIMNTIDRIAKIENISNKPKLGILKLGTGNAMASELKSSKFEKDAKYIVSGGKYETVDLDFVLL